MPSKYQARNRESTTQSAMFRYRRCLSCVHSLKVITDKSDMRYDLYCLLPKNHKMLAVDRFLVSYKYSCNRHTDRPKGVKQQMVDNTGKTFTPPVSFSRIIKYAKWWATLVLYGQASIKERAKATKLDKDGNWNMWYWEQKALKKMHAVVAKFPAEKWTANKLIQYLYDHGPYCQVDFDLKYRKSPLDGELNGLDKHSVIDKI